MATRGLSDKFFTLRNQIAPTRPVRFKPSQGDDVNVPLMLKTDGEEMGTAEILVGEARLLNVSIPPWLTKIKPIEAALDRIVIEMTELARMHNKKVHSLAFSQNSDVENNIIKAQEKKITTLMKDIKVEIKSLDIDSTKASNRQEVFMRSNIQMVLASKLQDLGNKYRKQQLEYRSQLDYDRKKAQSTTSSSYGKELDSSSSPTTTTGFDSFGGSKNHDHGDDSDDDADEVGRWDKGFTGGQLARLENNQFRIDQRNNEIREIASQVQEIGEMFQDIATMVHEQGSILERIDYNIEMAHENTTQAVGELTQVASGSAIQKRVCFLMILIVVAGAVIIGIVLYRQLKSAPPSTPS